MGLWIELDILNEWYFGRFAKFLLGEDEKHEVLYERVLCCSGITILLEIRFWRNRCTYEAAFVRIELNQVV